LARRVPQRDDRISTVKIEANLQAAEPVFNTLTIRSDMANSTSGGRSMRRSNGHGTRPDAASRLDPWRLNLRQLEMLVAVVDRGGYLAAGKHLHVAHSAVHRQIRLLQDSVGAKVLVRTGRAVQLTEIGRLLVDLTRRLDAEVVSTRMQIDSIHRRRLGTIRMGAATTMPIFFLPQVIRELRAQLPRLDIHIISRPTAQVMEMLQDHALDIGVVDDPAGVSERSLCSRQLYREEFALVVGRQHPLALLPSVQWSDFGDVPVMSLPHTARVRDFVDQRLRSAGIEPHVTMELEDEAAIIKMVELGFGAGLVARRRCTRETLHVLGTLSEHLYLDVVAAFDSTNISQHAETVLEACVRHAQHCCD
jgi:LysR family transcriptional regulator, cyn operon transcriptional activator